MNLTKYADNHWIIKRIWQGWRIYVGDGGRYVLSSVTSNNLRDHHESRRLQFFVNFAVVDALVEKGILYWYTPSVAALSPTYSHDKFSGLYELRSGIRPIHIRNYRTPRGLSILSRLQTFYDPIL